VAVEDDPLAANYGDTALVQSAEVTGRVWTRLAALGPQLSGQRVLVRGRVHAVRGKGKSAFLILRQQTSTLQVVFFVDDAQVSKGMVKYVCALTKESVLDLEGVVTVPESAITGASCAVELSATSVRCVSRALPSLPFDLEDASRPDAELLDAAGAAFPRVGADTRLDNRVLDLRTPANQAIFRLQAAVGLLFRECLNQRGFVEIHTPKLIAGASEGGASVFKLDYMGRPACLAQSPQLYKQVRAAARHGPHPPAAAAPHAPQMAVEADFERVFEIGPVFRAENSNTHRHLCEFTGLDFEMAINEHYFEVLDVLDALFLHIFDGLVGRFGAELEAVRAQHPFEPLAYCRPSLRLTFAEGVEMLAAAGVEVDPFGDLSTETERVLGRLVKEKYNTDFYILHRYPTAARPFYTMPCADDPRYTNSYDVFIRGEEIISGAQRVHDPAMLTQRATECGIDVASIAAYIDAFKFGALPHGGAGVGLERVVMLYLASGNIRKTSMFPRDPKRLTP